LGSLAGIIRFNHDRTLHSLPGPLWQQEQFDIAWLLQDRRCVLKLVQRVCRYSAKLIPAISVFPDVFSTATIRFMSKNQPAHVAGAEIQEQTSADDF